MEGSYEMEVSNSRAPAIIGRNGVRNVIDFDLNDTEAAQMQASAKTLKETIESAFDKLDMEA